ncbi:MAG: hypothetical protein NZM44_06080 [Candidatus Calescibacterium sp.]|nr:hypothetical protein [Candidatus Calescibacterium sp.]
MKKVILSVFLLLAVIISVFATAYKEYDIYNIVDNSVDTKKFYIGGFNNSSTTLLGMAPTVNIELKKQNKNYKLYFINFVNNDIKVIDIPMYSIQQYLFGRDDSRLFLIGNKLTTLAVINLSDYSYKEISKVEYGKDSFRFFGLIWFEDQNIFTTGYYMDKKQNATDDFIVKLEFSEQKVNFINTGFNISSFEKKFNPLNFVILNKEKIAFVGADKNRQYLGLIDKSLNMKKIDEGDTFSGLSFSDNFILYGIKKNGKIYYSLFDYNSNKIYLQNEINFPPSYNFISNNSSSIIIGDFKPKVNKMDIYIGKKENNYNLEKVLNNEMLGYIKISDDGKYFMFCQKNGKIRIYKI